MEGQPYQLFINLPFGETMAEQTGTGYQNPNKFNGKLQRSENPDASGELDPETWLYYYGARYYDPQSSTWLSVDPLAEKYAGWTPYNYCANNPIILTDKDGNKIWIADPNGGKPVLYTPNNTSQQDGVNSYIKTTSQALDYLINNGLDVKGVINTLASDPDNEIKIQDANWDSHINQVAGLISWSPEGGIITDEGGRQSPVIGLLHEVGEAYFDIYKPTELSRAVPQLTDFSSLEEFEVALDEYEAKCKIEAGGFKTINDKWVIQEVENPAAALKGDAVRYSHHYLGKYQAKNFISLENE